MNKKSVLHFLLHTVLLGATLALLAGAYMGLAYWRDPLHLFHPTQSERFFQNVGMRMLAAGFINSYEFDSAIIGNSMLQNVSSKDMEKSLDGRFMNLSMRGSLYKERAVVLDHLLRKKKVKHVVYGLDTFFGMCGEGGHPERFWTFLYDEDKWNDLKVYTDLRYFSAVLFGLPKNKGVSLDRPKAWGEDPYHTCRFGGLESWIKYMDRGGIGYFLTKELPKTAAIADPSRPIQSVAGREAPLQKHMEKYLFSRIENNRDTKFHLIFVPYWRYNFAKERQTAPEHFALHQNMVRYIIRRAEELGNVSVYGFEDCAFVDDVALYRDIAHYSQDIDRYMAESVGKDRHRLTSANVEAYLARCEELARKFDLKALNEEVQRLLAEKKK